MIPSKTKKKLADPDPITCDPGSRVHDPDPEAVIPDPIYLVTTLRCNSLKLNHFKFSMKLPWPVILLENCSPKLLDYPNFLFLIFVSARTKLANLNCLFGKQTLFSWDTREACETRVRHPHALDQPTYVSNYIVWPSRTLLWN